MSEIRERSFDDIFGDGSGPGDETPDPSPDEDGGRHRRPRWVTVLVVLLALVLVVVGGGVASLYWWRSSLDGNIERFGDPFTSIPDDKRPAVDPVAADATNILLLGSDSRISAGDPSSWVAGAQRTDAIMILHIAADRKSAEVISIPRDSWVQIPGKRTAKINAGFSLGGPSLMVQTVESVTGVRIDHVVIIDFTGFQQITDALGGVQICVPKQVDDVQGTIKAGCQIMDGETALRYVRQRKTLAGGDFDRVKRQQNWIRSVVRKLASRGTLTNPLKLNAALDALTSATATDNRLTIDVLSDLALSSRGIAPADVAFFTAPLADPPVGRSADGQSIVNLDPAKNKVLWQAVRTDAVVSYIAENDPNLLGESVR